MNLKTSLRISAWLAATMSLSNISFAGPIDDLLPGEWYEVPNSKLRDVSPDPTPAGVFSNVIRAWSGGTYDTNRDQLLVWGGGHADYAGNEIYGFDIDSLQWSRLSEPSADTGGDPDSGVYPDGKPRARHTYNYVEYLPAVDLMCSFGGAALYPSGNTSTERIDCFDVGARQWVRKAQKPSARGKLDSLASYDTASGKLYYKGRGSSEVAVYDPVADSWSEAQSFSMSSRRTSAIDPQRRLMLIIGRGETATWNIASGDYSIRSTSGSGPSKSSPGVDYDPVADRIVVWEGGATVYTLDVDTMNWQRRSPAPSNSVTPPDQTKWGTFGRFRYIASKNAFIVANDVDQNVYIYKLSAGNGMKVTRAESIKDLDAN